MSNTYLDKAIEAVPELGNRISLFTKKVRKKKSYLEICIEKGWDIGICKDCNCQRIITRIIKPARVPPFFLWRMDK